MLEEYQLNQKVTRAARAKQILEDELVVEAFANVRKSYLDQFKNTEYLEGNIREKCWLALRVVDVVEKHLQTAVAERALAESDLKELAKLGERKKLLGLV